MSGYFISIEGIDGSGKTTQANLLKRKLNDLGYKVTLTREPGGVTGAEEIRNLLVKGDQDRWSSVTEILLFFAARRHHLERCILPALDSGSIVICDRFTDSTLVYQGGNNPNLIKLINNLRELVVKREPDLTIVIDVDPSKSLSRGLKRKSKENRFELFGLEFQEKANLSYRSLSKELERCHLINGKKNIKDTHESIWKLVSNHINSI